MVLLYFIRQCTPKHHAKRCVFFLLLNLYRFLRLWKSNTQYINPISPLHLLTNKIAASFIPPSREIRAHSLRFKNQSTCIYFFLEMLMFYKIWTKKVAHHDVYGVWTLMEIGAILNIIKTAMFNQCCAYN